MIAGDDQGFVRYVRHPLPEVPEITEWVDLLLARQPIGRLLLMRAGNEPVLWQGIKLPVVSAEGLVLMTVLASVDDPSRRRDDEDIIGLLKLHPAAIDRQWVESSARTLGERYANSSNSHPHLTPHSSPRPSNSGCDPGALALDEWAALQSLTESIAQAASGDLWRRGPPPALPAMDLGL